MLNEKGFDQWAEDYEQSVALSDADDRYPFAGYRDILDTICRNVLSQGAKDVLDIGFGTGTLSAALYAQGCRIYGQDFSAQMLPLAQDRMPKATLFCGDFSQGLSTPLTQRTYDAIVATYSLHHLTDRQKVDFIRSLLSLLREGGCLYIGDVAFPSRAALEVCRLHAGDLWDADETYFVFDEMLLPTNAVRTALPLCRYPLPAPSRLMPPRRLMALIDAKRAVYDRFRGYIQLFFLHRQFHKESLRSGDTALIIAVPRDLRLMLATA